MTTSIAGVHHVTAIASDPQRNLDFYAGFLGLRFVKRTINYDDPGTYHLYFGDEGGRPGTLLTFFPYPGAIQGRRGAGQATVVTLTVPEGSFEYWIHRALRYAVPFKGPVTRFGERVLAFEDPDGLALELVADAAAAGRTGWAGGPVPAESAIRGLHAITLTERSAGPTAQFLTATLGFRELRRDGNRVRYETGNGGATAMVDVIEDASVPFGRVSAGTVHHIAWRTPDEASQQGWREVLTERGSHVSPVMDRQYFHSIYFREPGGVLFEIATDGPGFTADESLEALGGQLKLPAWLEEQRAAVEEGLPPLRAPSESPGVPAEAAGR